MNHNHQWTGGMHKPRANYGLRAFLLSPGRTRGALKQEINLKYANSDLKTGEIFPTNVAPSLKRRKRK